ncbi:Ribonuclease P protein component [Nymphon striatum]|nr:Ribonuclease P protein component [Nymphon striatum]
MQRVEGMEELFLERVLAFEELNVIDQQDIVLAVAPLEVAGRVGANGIDELAQQRFGRDVTDPIGRISSRRHSGQLLAADGFCPARRVEQIRGFNRQRRLFVDEHDNIEGGGRTADLDERVLNHRVVPSVDSVFGDKARNFELDVGCSLGVVGGGGVDPSKGGQPDSVVELRAQVLGYCSPERLRCRQDFSRTKWCAPREGSAFVMRSTWLRTHVDLVPDVCTRSPPRAASGTYHHHCALVQGVGPRDCRMSVVLLLVMTGPSCSIGHLVGCPAELTIGTNREENFPAERTPPLKAPWLPHAHVNQGRPPHCAGSPPSRTPEAVGLIRPLSSRASFDALARSGRRHQGQWCWMRWAPAPPDHESVPHVGYAIGRSVGNAVVRNRIRRRIRAVLADEAVELRAGLYLIGVKNAKPASMDFDRLQADVRALVRAVDETADAY